MKMELSNHEKLEAQDLIRRLRVEVAVIGVSNASDLMKRAAVFSLSAAAEELAWSLQDGSSRLRNVMLSAWYLLGDLSDLEYAEALA